MTLAQAQAYLDPAGGETQYYVSPQDIKDAFSVIYTDLTTTETARVTHPNTDDILIEVFDGTNWNVALYDSGIRSITIGSSWTSGTVEMRRVNDLVFCEVDNLAGSTSLTNSMVAIPTQFAPSSSQLRLITAWQGNATSGKPVWLMMNDNYGGVLNYKGAHFDGTAWSSSYPISLATTWMTSAAIPTSLPGTLVTAGGM